MSEINLIEDLIVAENPKTQEGEGEFIYLPIATHDSMGIAKYSDDFIVVDGTVYISDAYRNELNGILDDVEVLHDSVKETEAELKSWIYLQKAPPLSSLNYSYTFPTPTLAMIAAEN